MRIVIAMLGDIVVTTVDWAIYVGWVVVDWWVVRWMIGWEVRWIVRWTVDWVWAVGVVLWSALILGVLRGCSDLRGRCDRLLRGSYFSENCRRSEHGD